MENELLKIGAAYVRVSDERQDEYSPDSQLKKIREFAAKEGYLIPDEYVYYDDGISGKSTKKRDQFNLMIAMAKEKNHPFEVIYVWKFSRFARNQEEAIVYKNLLRKAGVSVKSVSEPIPEDHFGTLIERVIEWMDEFYLINLGVEVSRGMEEKTSRGEPAIPAPFGYINGEKTYLPEIENGEADIVREIFQRFADGEGMREIAVSLGKRGVHTKRGNMPESRWIEYMLNNPSYIGKIRWTPDGSKVVSKRDYTNENIQIRDGNWQPLISIDLWDKVQERLQAIKLAYPKHARQQQPIDYMLKGLVRCSACGATLAYNGTRNLKAKKKTHSLQCCNYARGSCHTSHSISVNKLERAFIKGLEQAIENKQFVITPKTPKQTEKPEIDYDKLIAVEERKLERAKQAYLAEIDSIEQYGKNKAEITARIEKLKQDRDNVIVKDIDFNSFSEKVMSILEFIKREDVTPLAKNEALHNIIEKVVYEKAEGNLAIYFHDI